MIDRTSDILDGYLKRMNFMDPIGQGSMLICFGKLLIFSDVTN